MVQRVKIMMLIYLCLAILVLDPTAATNEMDTFQKEEVIPDVIDTAPHTLIDVRLLCCFIFVKVECQLQSRLQSKVTWTEAGVKAAGGNVVTPTQVTSITYCKEHLVQLLHA